MTVVKGRPSSQPTWFLRFLNNVVDGLAGPMPRVGAVTDKVLASEACASQPNESQTVTPDRATGHDQYECHRLLPQDTQEKISRGLRLQWRHVIALCRDSVTNPSSGRVLQCLRLMAATVTQIDPLNGSAIILAFLRQLREDLDSLHNDCSVPPTERLVDGVLKRQRIGGVLLDHISLFLDSMGALPEIYRGYGVPSQFLETGLVELLKRRCGEEHQELIERFVEALLRCHRALLHGYPDIRSARGRVELPTQSLLESAERLHRHLESDTINRIDRLVGFTRAMTAALSRNGNSTFDDVLTAACELA